MEDSVPSPPTSIVIFYREKKWQAKLQKLREETF